MGMGQKIALRLPMILGTDAQASALFIDTRRNKGMNAEGRRPLKQQFTCSLRWGSS